MKNFKQTKQFLFRLFLAGIFLILYAVTASAIPVSAQGGISDNQRKASASLITWDAYQGLDEAELSSGVWRFCGRAELGALTGETYYDGALYVETLGDRSDYFVLAGDSLAWTGYSQSRSLGMLPDKPYLYGGKERMRDGQLNDYDFSARRLNSALALWTAPDPMARDFSNINPYVYCAANLIRYIDPTGMSLNISGDAILQMMMQLIDNVKGINLTINFKTGDVCYSENGEKMNDHAKTLKTIIDDKEIFVKVTSQNSKYLENGNFFIGGAFMGNVYDKKTNTVTAFQTVNPDVLNKISSASGKPGQDMMHEISEAYEGGKIALKNKTSYTELGDSNSIYSSAHTQAVPQSCAISSFSLINYTYKFFSTSYATGIALYCVNSYNFNGEKPTIESAIILTVPYILNRLKPSIKKLW